MDLQSHICNVLEDRYWTYRIDPLDGEVITGYSTTIDGEQHGSTITIIPQSTSVLIRGRRIADTGGRDGTFHPQLAAFVATIAYDVDIQVGVDTRDGEIEARAVVEFAGVAEDLRVRLLARALQRFLIKHRRVLGSVISYQRDERSAVTGLDLQGAELEPSA